MDPRAVTMESLGRRRRAFLGTLLAVALALASHSPARTAQAPPPGVADDRGAPAYVLDRGAVSGRQVVALGRDLMLHGEALRGAAVLSGDALVSGVVRGDLVVLDGSAVLESGARVDGDVVVLGGELRLSSEARVGGRTVAYPTASRSLLALLEVRSLGGRPVLLSAQIGLVLAWWLAGSVLLIGFPAPVLDTARQVGAEPLRNFWVGLTLILGGTLVLLLLSAVAPAVLTAPLVALLVLVAFVLKIWGTVALLLAFGTWLSGLGTGGSGRRVWPADALGRFLLGLGIVGAVKLVPWLGSAVWSMATLVGVGAATVRWTSGMARAESAPRRS